MKRSRSRAVIGILIFVVVAVSFWMRARSTTEQLTTNWRSLSFTSIIFSFVIVLVCFVWAACAWFVSLRLLGGQLGLGRALRIYFLSSLPRYVPGMVWGYLGRTYLCEREGVAHKVTLFSSFVEICLFVGTGFSIGLAHWQGWVKSIYTLLSLQFLLAIGLTIITSTTAKQWRDFKQVSSTFLLWNVLILAYVAFWIVYGLSLVVLVQSVKPTINQAQIIHIISGFTMSWLVGFATVLVPGGLGVREAGIVLALEPIAGSMTAVYIAVLSRFLNLAADALLFLLVLPGHKLAEAALD